jgi:8-oxo-dGTP pyrophosphatase MutT (NUDIX family)
MAVDLQLLRSFFSSYQRSAVHDSPLRPSAVLVPFLLHPDGLHLIFTKRTESVEHHKGQISFPGGAVDSGDADRIATALRETEEEIGIARASVEVLGMYDDFSIPSGFCITPVTGFLSEMPRLKIHKAEVDEVFTIPVQFFLEPGSERSEMRELNGISFPVYFYGFGKHCIWGATAAILRGLLRSLQGFSQKR